MYSLLFSEYIYSCKWNKYSTDEFIVDRLEVCRLFLLQVVVTHIARNWTETHTVYLKSKVRLSIYTAVKGSPIRIFTQDSNFMFGAYCIINGFIFKTNIKLYALINELNQIDYKVIN